MIEYMIENMTKAQGFLLAAIIAFILAMVIITGIMWFSGEL